MKKYGPGFVTDFRVYSDFLDESVLVHDGLATGTLVGRHSMLLVGVKGTGESKVFMLQNWCRKKQFVRVSTSYLAYCLPLIYFSHSADRNRQTVFCGYGGYAESGGIDAEDRHAWDTTGDEWSDSDSISEPFEE